MDSGHLKKKKGKNNKKAIIETSITGGHNKWLINGCLIVV